MLRHCFLTSMRKLRGLFFISCLFITSANAGTNASTVIADIEGKRITVAEFEAEVKRRAGVLRTEEQKQRFFEEMVRFEVLYLAALREGYDKRSDIAEEIRRLIANRMRQERLIPEIEKITVTDEEVEAYYRTNKGKFMVPDKVRASVIRISVPAKASPEYRQKMKKRAEQAREEAMKPEPGIQSLGSLAVKYSDDQSSRYRGGDAGMLTKDSNRWEKAVMDAIFALDKPGALTPVIETGEGYYIAKLIEKMPAVVRPLDEVRDMVRHEVFDLKRRQAENAFYDSLIKDIRINVYPDVLRQIEVKGVDEKVAPPPFPVR